jgi:glycosyltransferase involved in cell wall biosynthesis
MRIISLNYSVNRDYTSPQQWLDRISFSAGILTALSKLHEVIAIEQIACTVSYQSSGMQYKFVEFYKGTPLLPLRLHRLVKQLKPDVVMVHGLIYPLQVLQLRRTLGKSVKIYAIHHAEQPFTGIKKWLQQRADRCIDAYQFTSMAFGTDWARAGIVKNMQKVYAIMEGSSVYTQMDKQAASQRTGVCGNPVYLWVGRLDANKDPQTVVKAFIAFVRQQPGARLYMIYQTTELLNEVKALVGNNEAIKFTGKKSRQELEYWYNSADFIVSGSHYEGSGIAVCEAMSCGCIPIVTAIHSFKAMTDEGKCGLLYKAGDETALLDILLQSVQLNREAERDKVLQQFNAALSFDAIAAAIHRVFVSLQLSSVDSAATLSSVV